MMRTFLFFFFAALFSTNSTVAQTAPTVSIRFQIAGFKSPYAHIGRYYGGDLYRVDSVTVDAATGTFQFTKSGLRPGVYFVGVEEGRLFDFLITSPSDSFQVSGNATRFDSLTAGHSEENRAFFDFERKRKSVERRMSAKRSMLEMLQRATKNDPEVMRPIRAEMQKMIQEVDALGREFQRKYPKHYYARALHSIETPDVPQKVKADQRKNAALRWTKAHYFDYTDWRDSALLCNNLWPTFFDNYFNRLTVAQADSIITSADRILKKMPKHGAFYRFAVVRLARTFEQSDFVGADKIFVHMVDFYQKKDDTPWVDEAMLLRLAAKADLHRPNLTGNPAPLLTLSDENDVMVSVQSIPSPMLLLVFYSPLCNHCMEFMPGIYQTWLDYEKSGLKAVAVNTDDQFNHWRQFVSQQQWRWTDLADPTGKNTFERDYAAYNLPVIYLLDKNKKILRKRIEPAQLGAVLGEYLVKK